MIPPPPRSTLFPYTTLFRSRCKLTSVTMSSAPNCSTQGVELPRQPKSGDRKSTRLNSSHLGISYAVFCLKKKSCPADVHAPVAGTYRSAASIGDPAAQQPPL